MDIEFIRSYCLSRSAVTEDTPFDQDTLVFKVAGKMFALFSISEFNSINLKCDPELALEYRERYDAVAPGYHMNKKHWNTVYFDGDVNESLLLQMIDHSYDLVVKKLPARLRKEFDL